MASRRRCRHEGGFAPVRLKTLPAENPSRSVRLGLRALASSPSEIRHRAYAFDFIESSGVQTVVLGLKQARQRGHAVEVDRRVSSSVERLIEMMGIGSQLWPA